MDERYVSFNGALIPYSEATIPGLSDAVKYATSVFEGLRAYWSDRAQESYVFRPEDHVRCLLDSLRRMAHTFTGDDLKSSVVLDTLRNNRSAEDVHIRQTAYLA